MPTNLVCEGRCNDGQVQPFDEALQRAREPVALGEMSLALARRFVYTVHEAVSEYEYRCTVCGTERRYGSSRTMRPWRAEGEGT